MLKQCTDCDKLPAGISSLAIRAKLDALQQMGITEPTLACSQQYITTLRELRALHGCVHQW